MPRLLRFLAPTSIALCAALSAGCGGHSTGCPEGHDCKDMSTFDASAIPDLSSPHHDGGMSDSGLHDASGVD